MLDLWAISICLFFSWSWPLSRKFRNIEEKLQREEIETKVNVQIAEGDLKAAIKEIVEKEKDFLEVREMLVLKNKDISTMRGIYLKLAYFLALAVVLLMFLLTFVIFAFEKVTSISKVSYNIFILLNMETIFLESLFIFCVYGFRAFLCPKVEY